jgi:N-acetylglutamate synthase-like GNAT family acetyltransferase
VNPEIVVQRARRQDLASLARLIAKATDGKKTPDETELLENFLTRSYFIASSGKHLLGAAGWGAENLVATVEELYVASDRIHSLVAPSLLKAIEEAADELFCEVVLLAVPANTPEAQFDTYQGLGYEPQPVESLHKYWREEAERLLAEGATVLLKRLREARVVKPI